MLATSPQELLRLHVSIFEVITSVMFIIIPPLFNNRLISLYSRTSSSKT
jgi:hypothetical protein